MFMVIPGFLPRLVPPFHGMGKAMQAVQKRRRRTFRFRPVAGKPDYAYTSAYGAPLGALP
jgi:hypothetical protein